MQDIVGKFARNSGSRMALAVALVMTASAAWAQDAEQPASDNAGVEEIVVTAQFRNQNLQKTPLAITAVTGDMLQARSQTDISQVAAQAPSVTLKPQGAAYGPSLGASIRGIGQFDFNPALEPGVGVYVDDVYYATLTGSIFDLLDLDRVEVLRGPQGTLSGRNSIGGAVKLFSKKPEGSNTGSLTATYGSRDRMEIRGSFDLGIADTLSARISGVSKKQDGYIKRLDFGCVNPIGSANNPVGGIPATGRADKNCVLAKEGEVNYQAVRGQLRWEPSDAIEVNLTGDYTYDDRVIAGSVLTYANYTGAGQINPYPNQSIRYDERFICGKYCNYSTFEILPDTLPNGTVRPGSRADGRSHFEGYGFSGIVDWRLSDRLAVKSISAYRAYNTMFSNDDDLSPMSHSLGGPNKLTFWSFSQELRLNGSFGANDEIEYTLGGFYMDQRSVYKTRQNLRYATPAGTAFLGNDPVNADSKAVFAHVSYKATDKLTLNGGIRYTDEHKDYTFSRKNPDGTPNSAVDGATGIYNGSRVDYRANVQYQWTPELMTYAQFSTGFKGGGISPRPFFPSQVKSFGPETLKSYEVGVKSDLFDRRLRLNVAGFYADYSDIQLSLSNCPFPDSGFPATPCALISNAGDARIKGFEVEASARPIEGFLIDAAVSYTDFDYKKGSINPDAGGPGRPNGPQYGDVPPYVPAWKWSIGAQYEVDLGNTGSLTPRIDVSYQDTLWTNAANRDTNRIGAYTLANARLTWANADKDLEVSAEVTNLFDKYYYLTEFDLTIANGGVSSAQPGRPREWALTVKKRF
ncbi:MAG TPA: TonB-dependent receptor [Sphingomonadaceae bacterium]|nr:TonB-dependent receptor [Sphingomonadaceae bacterium]